MRAVVRLLPGPNEMSSALGSQMAQALSAFGGPGGGRIPVEIPAEDRQLVVEGAVRSANDAHVLRFFDADDAERAVVPLQRVDTVVFEAD